MEFPEPHWQFFTSPNPCLNSDWRRIRAHPKDGLFLYGPSLKPKKSRDVRVGIVGTPRSKSPISAPGWPRSRKGSRCRRPERAKSRIDFTSQTFLAWRETFQIAIDEQFLVALTLDAKLIDRMSRILNHHEAVSTVVDLYASHVRRHVANDERAVDLWVLVVPELVFERCRPDAKRAGLPMKKGDLGKKQRKRSDLPLLNDLVDHASEEIFDDVPDFHRQVKAAFLTITPTQILRETTLAPTAFLNKAGYPIRKLQDRATVAWNIATGL